MRVIYVIMYHYASLLVARACDFAADGAKAGAMDASSQPLDKVAPGRAAGPRPRALISWLLVVAALVALIIAVGGITRVTGSGLSITEWKPVTGTIPPLSEAQWEREFAAYREIPQYLHVSGPAGMTMADYKFIYFWEWFHRLLGRLIGVAFAVPLAWFWLRGAIPAGYKPRLVALLGLGGLQGVFGWYMVRSGLSGEMTSVSHFWLSIHLLTALFTLAGLVWTALDLRVLAKDPAARPARLAPLAIWTSLVLFVQLLLGAWVAGLNAGHASSSWPLMQERLVPEADWSQGALWAFTHDPFLLHFLHRWWAFAALAALILLARATKRAGERRFASWLHIAVGGQIILGIATVVTGVDLWLAVAHQFVGALLVVAVTLCAHTIAPARPALP